MRLRLAAEGRDEVDTSTFISPTLSLLFSKQLWLCCVFVCGWPGARCIYCVCSWIVFMSIILLGRQWRTCRTATPLCSGEKRGNSCTSFDQLRRSCWHTKLNFQFSVSIYSRSVWRTVMYAHIHPHYCPFSVPRNVPPYMVGGAEPSDESLLTGCRWNERKMSHLMGSNKSNAFWQVEWSVSITYCHCRRTNTKTVIIVTQLLEFVTSSVV